MCTICELDDKKKNLHISLCPQSYSGCFSYEVEDNKEKL